MIAAALAAPLGGTGRTVMCQRNQHNTTRRRAFTAPEQVNHRRYEALRAYFVDGLSYAEAGARFGYTRWAMINLVRDYRKGKLELFAPPRKPGPAPGTAPAKERVRGPGDRAAPRRAVQLRDLRPAGRRAHPAQPHQRRRDPRRGRLRTAAAPPRADRQHQPGHRRPRHPAAPHHADRLPILARHSRNRQGRAAAAGARPGRTRPARPGAHGRLPGHPGGARDLVAAVAAGAQADPHPPGLPRRRPADRRPGRLAVRRAGHPAEEVRAHRLLLPHRPRPPAPLPGRPRRPDDRSAGWPPPRTRSSTWTSTPSCTGATTPRWRSTTCPPAPNAPAPC